MKRRSTITLLAAIIALGVVNCSSREQLLSPGEVTVVSYGGAFQEAQRKAFFEPFERETGIKVREVVWDGEYAKLRKMVEAGQVSWDLVTAAEASIVARGAADGILERIDFTEMDTAAFYPGVISEISVGFCYFSTVMAYDKRAFSDSTSRPKTWGEFWDTAKYPGKRALRRDPRTTLEFALLADGVSIDKLYPLDLERAFRSLDRIRPHIAVWWQTGSQPAQLLADREVGLSSAFNGRIWAAASRDGVPLDVQWEGGALDMDTWIIPKGAKRREAAMALIRFSARPEAQRELTKYINYGPTVRAAYEQLSAAERMTLPSSPENRGKHFIFNGAWWAENEQRVLERWNTWMLER